MFRRRRHDDDSELEGELDPDLEPEAGGDTLLPAGRPEGPWDEADVPDDGVDRVDLGALRVPVSGGQELRVDVEPESGQVVSVTVSTPTSAMQVGAFAAPRSSGIWDEVRAEITASLQAGGGSAEEVTGPFGLELRAQVPTDVAGQHAPARFLGVDGPRWFLRAMLQGKAATDPEADPGLLATFAQVVVHRGGDAMVVRDALPLRLPADVVQQLPAAEDAAAAAPAPDLSLPERGPEITEIR